ncbi:hypothetical protein QQ045_033173 [Rhodiola kirilowii]
MSGIGEDAQPFPSAEVATDKDSKAVFNRLMESGKADMNRVYQKFMDVRQCFTRAMAADPCDCQLKDFYKCADEEGSDIQNCQSVMDKLFECRKNLKGSNPQKN